MDGLEPFAHRLAWDEILAARAAQMRNLHKPNVTHYPELLAGLPAFRSALRDYSGPVVRIGGADELNPDEARLFERALQAFVPWKKGPFELFGHAIDAEWRSDLKWGRILPHKESLRGRIVADIGCHNGYFMLRMLPERPALVVGFEPYAKNYYNFMLMQRFAQEPELQYELLGIEHLDLFPDFFDTIFCLGVLYHCQDPIAALRRLAVGLRRGGELILECQGIPGELPVALSPRQRYANTRGIWFLPTVSCLENWLARTGFGTVECFFVHALGSDEQRTTAWAPIESLADFLADGERTREGYPAPLRIYVRAVREG